MRRAPCYVNAIDTNLTVFMMHDGYQAITDYYRPAGSAAALSSPAGGCYEAGVRPRFILVLCLAGVLAAVVELLDVIVGDPAARSHAALLGLRFGGNAGRLVRAIEACALGIGAWGLWHLRPWARVGAMSYLAAVILSFLFLGVGTGSDRAAWTLVWQISVVPFATFCYMFLYNGRRYFGAGDDTFRVR
jgi:hypothetical protein